MMMNRCLAGVLLLVGLLVGGCTTDQPIVSNPRGARIEGVELYNRGDYWNAAGAFRNAVHQDPRDYRGHYFLGLSYERLGNYQQAVQSYKSALKVMRETPAGREDVDYRQIIMNTLASTITRHDSNMLEQELLAQQAGDSSRSSRERAENYFLLAKTERYRGDADSALLAYFKGSELDPADFWLQKEAGLYMLQMGKNNQAAIAIARAGKMNSRDPEVVAAMGQLKISGPLTLGSTGTGGAALFNPRPRPNVPLQVTEPVTLPDELPRD